MGNEFIDLFDKWADSYDQTVAGFDQEYKSAFLHYDEILQAVADLSFGNVLEFGSGTGNLTLKLLNNGLNVIGVEPSKEMRKVANEKLNGKVQIVEGDFFHFPQNISIHTIASSYAFHHLTDEEKANAIALYSSILPCNGKIVFADTLFQSPERHQEAINNAINKGYDHLAKDLQSEYYTTIPTITTIMENNQFHVEFKKYNDFVWIMDATKI